MSDYQNLDLRNPENRRESSMSLRGILITLAVVFGLFLLLTTFGGNDGDDAAVPAGDGTAPAVTQQEGTPPPATEPAGQ